MTQKCAQYKMNEDKKKKKNNFNFKQRCLTFARCFEDEEALELGDALFRLQRCNLQPVEVESRDGQRSLQK